MVKLMGKTTRENLSTKMAFSLDFLISLAMEQGILVVEPNFDGGTPLGGGGGGAW